MDIRNAQLNADGSMDCEIEHAAHGWIPFTASPHDVEPLGRAVHAALLAGDAGEIAPYEPPPPPDLEDARTTARATVDTTFAAKVCRYPHDFGAPFGVKHLQLRTPTDQANWLTLQAKAERHVAAGEGDTALLGIRTEDNTTVPVTAAQAAEIMDALAGFGGNTKARAWAIKDLIAVAPTPAAVAAVLAAELDIGWPIDEL